VNQGEGPEVEQAFWGYLGVAPEELPAAKARVRERSFLSGEDEDVDLVLYRVEDLQEERRQEDIQRLCRSKMF